MRLRATRGRLRTLFGAFDERVGHVDQLACALIIRILQRALHGAQLRRQWNQNQLMPRAKTAELEISSDVGVLGWRGVCGPMIAASGSGSRFRGLGVMGWGWR